MDGISLRKSRWGGTNRATAGLLRYAAPVAALCLGLVIYPAFPVSAEDTVMPTAGNKAAATTDANVSKSTTGGCKVSASASSSSSSTGSGETVTRESHKYVEGPCGSATANAKSTSGNGAGESDGQAE